MAHSMGIWRGPQMSKKHRKFADIWASQGRIGAHYGLSAIAVGKELQKAGLKDPQTKQATQKAIDEGYAKSTPLRDGTPYSMWNKQKIQSVLSGQHQRLNDVD